MGLLSGHTPIILAALPFAAALGLLALGRFEALVLVVLLGRSTLEYAGEVVAPGAQLTTLLAAGFTIVALAWLALQHLQHLQHPQQDGWRRLSPFARAAVVFAATGLLGVVASPAPGMSAGILARLLAFAVAVVALERLLSASAATTRRVLAAVIASSILPILLTLYQVGTGNGLQLIDGYLRSSGTFIHPNEFAIYLTFLMVMEAALLLTLRGRLQWLVGGLFLATGVALLHTYTRGAWIAVAAGLLVVGLLHSRVTLAALSVAGLLALALLPSVRGRFADIVHPQPERTEWGAPANSLAWRIGHWGESIALARDTPATGAGLGMINADSDFEAHNDYVRAYAETGIIGLAAYLWLLAGLMRNAAHSLRLTHPRTVGRAIAQGFAGCAVAFAVISITDNVITSLADMWYFAAFAAAAAAAAVHSVHSGAESHADPARQ